MDAKKFNRLLGKIKCDKRAIEKIYSEYYLKMKNHVLRRFGKLVDIDDLMHDIFLKLLTVEIPGPVEYPTTWLYRFADNYTIDMLRTRHIEEVALNETVLGAFDLGKTILKEDVKSAMRQLDEVSQKILYLHYWEGYPLHEIAAELNVSYPNVRAKACRAYQTLKIYL